MIGVASLAGILLLNRLLPKLPSVLIVVVLAAVAVNALDLEARGVDTVGVIPQGFPPFTIPAVSGVICLRCSLGALAIAVVALADTMSTASAFAARRGEQVRGNQEMVGIGAANIAAGFFQGFPVSTSGSRTAVAEQAGSRSQVTGVVGAAVITLVLVFATGADASTCRSRRWARSSSSRRCRWPTSPGRGGCGGSAAMEFTLSIIALLGVALLGVLPGILVAVGLSILERVPPHLVAVPGRARPGRGHRWAARHRAVPQRRAVARSRRLPLRCAPDLRERADVRRGDAGDRRRSDPDLRWIVVAAEPITDVDTTASDMLQELDLWLNERGTSLVFAEMKDPVREKIERYELTDTIDPAHFFPTLDEALVEYVRQTGAVWPDKGAGS